jgi:hypothetical protein
LRSHRIEQSVLLNKCKPGQSCRSSRNRTEKARRWIARKSKRRSRTPSRFAHQECGRSPARLLRAAIPRGQCNKYEGSPPVQPSCRAEDRAGFLISVAATALLGAKMGLVDDGIGAVPGAVLGALVGAFACGFEGLSGNYEPRSNPVVDPAHPYPAGGQWGDPTVN